MIDRTHALPVSRQARLVGIARSSVYYRAQPVSEADQLLMRRIDALHLEFPFAGARMLARLLRREGREIGRIRGYPGDAFFFGLLDRILTNAGSTSGRS